MPTHTQGQRKTNKRWGLILAPVALLGFLPLGAKAPKFAHVPHDTAYAVAAAILPDGTQEVVVITDDKTVLSSRDDLLTFGLIAGGGLDSKRPTSVSYNPTLPWSSDPQEHGLFLIGAEGGLFAYEPNDSAGQGLVYKFQNGLPGGVVDGAVQAIVSPQNHGGSMQPSFVLLRDGTLYRLNKAGTVWKKVFTPPAYVSRVDSAVVAVAPSFDKDVTGEDGTVMVGINEELFISTTGGGQNSFQLSPAFGLGTGWLLTSLCFDFDFGNTPGARIYAGRSKGIPNTEEGELLASTDLGQSFEWKHSLQSGVFSITASPSGPTQGPAVYAVGREFPGTGGYTGTGVLRSIDQGDSWDDLGTWQCFLLENTPGQGSGYPKLKNSQQLLVLPDYETRGKLVYGRNEGLFYSEDEGALWLQASLRTSEDIRGMTVTPLPGSGQKIFAATYGEGTLGKDFGAGTGTEEIGQSGMSVIYQLPVSASPSFEVDGTILAGGASAVVAWYDPVVQPPMNPYSTTGAKKLTLRKVGTGEPFSAYVRTLAISPNFDGSGATNDQVFYFGSWKNKMFVSDDGGLTYRDAKATTAGTLPYIIDLQIASSFDASQPHSDVYGIGVDASLWRMTNDVWNKLGRLGGGANALHIDPDFDPVTNRRIWIGMDDGQGVLEVLDPIGGPIQVNRIAGGLPSSRVTDLETVRDGQDLWLYCATWADGIYKLLVDGGGSWVKVSDQGFPRAWVKSLALSKDWTNDRKIFVGTGAGIFSFVDDGSPQTWEREFASLLVDSEEASLTTFTGPTGPAPDFNLPWPWGTVSRHQLPGGGFGPDALLTAKDGSRALARGWARKVYVHTFAGASAKGSTGTLTVTATNLETRQVVASTTVDLGAEAVILEPYELLLDLASPTAIPVEIELEVALDQSEGFVLDALRFER